MYKQLGPENLRDDIGRHNADSPTAAPNALPSPLVVPNTKALVVLMELRPALDGYAGIPQETRLLFRGLSLVPGLKIEGLMQAPRRHLARGVRSSHDPSVGDATNAHRRINRHSRVVISLLGPSRSTPLTRGNEYLRSRLRSIALTFGTLVGITRIRLDSFRSTHFEDFVWRSFFAKTLPAGDYPLVSDLDMRVCSVSWHAMHSVGLNLLRLLRRAIYPRIDTSGVDVLVAQTPFPGRVTGKTRLIVRYHDAIPVFMPHTIADRSAHQAEHFNALMNCVRSGAWFACVSEATRRDLLRLFPQAASRAVVIHNMVSHHYFAQPYAPDGVAEIVRSRINKGDNRHCLARSFVSPTDEQRFYADALGQAPLRYLLIVSTIEPRKNHSRLLAAWEAIRAQIDPDLKLIVVGSLGWSAGEIVTPMQPWIDRGSLFALHSVPAQDLRILYRHAAATVCPSLGEGFDYSGVEAMRCGGVVVASDIAVHREIYDDACRYFDPYSTSSLIDALTEILHAPNAAALQDQLRDRGASVSERYLPQRVLPQWQALLAAAPTNSAINSASVRPAMNEEGGRFHGTPTPTLEQES